jgi:F0F1-type ATP synthase membrane subunit c/vacuolar-type H+-ATPase subunit K
MSNKGTWIFGTVAAVLLAGLASPAFAQTAAAASDWGPLVAKIVLGLGLSLALSGSAMGLSVSFSALLGGGTENFYKLIPVALMPGSQGIYGIVVFFTNLDKFDSDPYTVAGRGAIAGLVLCLSAWYQGIVCAAGIRSCLEGRNTLANALVSGAMPETYAVFGLVMTFIIK